MKTLIKLTLTIGLLLNLNSCEKCDDPCDKRCDNYDPCCGVISFSGNGFSIFEDIGAANDLVFGFESFPPMDTDTLCSHNRAILETGINASSYSWKFQNDPIVYHGKKVFKHFGSYSNYTPIKIRLTVYKSNIKFCDENAMDTLVFERTLITVPRDSSKVYGKFVGYINDQFTELKTFEVINGLDPTNPWNRTDTLKPVFSSCSVVQPQGKVGFASLYYRSVDDNNCCLNVVTSAEVRGDTLQARLLHSQLRTVGDTCEIDEQSGKAITHFKGFRI